MPRSLEIHGETNSTHLPQPHDDVTAAAWHWIIVGSLTTRFGTHRKSIPWKRVLLLTCEQQRTEKRN